MKTTQKMTREELQIAVYESQGYVLREFTFGSSNRPAWCWSATNEIHFICFSKEDALHRLLLWKGNTVRDIASAWQLLVDCGPDFSTSHHGGFRVRVYGGEPWCDEEYFVPDVEFAALAMSAAFYAWKTGVRVEITD